MSDTKRRHRARIVRALRGERNAVRAEQLRAKGLPDPVIAARLGVPAAAVASWFDLQDDLVLGDVDGAA